MEIPKQLIDCLAGNKVSYEVMHHPEAVTAQRIAQAEHVKGRHHAKVVMVKSGDQHFMMVLPADHQIDLEKVEKWLVVLRVIGVVFTIFLLAAINALASG